MLMVETIKYVRNSAKTNEINIKQKSLSVKYERTNLIAVSTRKI